MEFIHNFGLTRPTRLQGPLHRLRRLGALVVGLHIVMPLVGQQGVDLLTVFAGDTAGHQLVQNRHHLVPAHVAALQQDIEDRQDLVVTQTLGGGVGQPVTLGLGGEEDVLHQHLFRKKAAQGLQIPLDAAYSHVKFLRQLPLIQGLSVDEPGVDDEHACGFRAMELL